jgi:dTMP kinase
MTGKLIVIEGLEGAGKSTAIQTVVDLLAQRDITSITVREPGGTSIGEALRSIIKNPEYTGILEDRTELLLFYAARVQLVEQLIKPALQQGTWVIADRFESSTLAYQGGGRGLNLEMIAHLSKFCLNEFKPDLIVYLDISPELGMQRAKLRGAFDRIEQQTIDFFHRVHENYLKQLQDNPSIVTIDASFPLAEVQYAIQKTLNPFIEQIDD